MLSALILCHILEYTKSRPMNLCTTIFMESPKYTAIQKLGKFSKV